MAISFKETQQSMCRKKLWGIEKPENQLTQILQEYTPECIFNGDESGLYYKRQSI